MTMAASIMKEIISTILNCGICIDVHKKLGKVVLGI